MNNTINRHFQQTKGQFYQNSGYCNNREDKQILIGDMDDSDRGVSLTTSPGTFSKTLHEPLKIDVLSDIYLDNFTTFNCLIELDVNDK